MAKYCDNGCRAVCDFCKYYKDDGSGTDEFEGEGICLITGLKKNASSYCEDNFECTLYKEET